MFLDTETMLMGTHGASHIPGEVVCAAFEVRTIDRHFAFQRICEVIDRPVKVNEYLLAPKLFVCPLGCSFNRSLFRVFFRW